MTGGLCLHISIYASAWLRRLSHAPFKHASNPSPIYSTHTNRNREHARTPAHARTRTQSCSSPKRPDLVIIETCPHLRRPLQLHPNTQPFSLNAVVPHRQRHAPAIPSSSPWDSFKTCVTSFTLTKNGPRPLKQIYEYSRSTLRQRTFREVHPAQAMVKTPPSCAGKIRFPHCNRQLLPYLRLRPPPPASKPLNGLTVSRPPAASPREAAPVAQCISPKGWLS